MANERKNNQLEAQREIEKLKTAQKNKQINNQEEFGEEQNFNANEKRKEIVSERSMWH